MQVCALREQRLDQEDIVADITKSCEQVKKEQESLKQKLKRVELALSASEAAIQEFQREKQAKLNEIDVIVLMHAHQIEYLVDQKLPTDLSGALIFSNKELSRLLKRIDVRLNLLASCLVLGCRQF
jgi:septal ring factor EnvC (AmiA/AmiB activator)